MPFLDIEDSGALKLVTLQYKRAPAETKKEMRDATKRLAPALRSQVAQESLHPIHQQVARSTRLTVTNRGLKGVWGSAGRLRDGTPLRRVVRPFEFGDSTPNDYTRYLTRHRISGRSYLVNRRTERQLPSRRKQGYSIYPAAAQFTPRLVSAWIKAMAGVVTYGR